MDAVEHEIGNQRSAAPALWAKLISVAVILGAGACGALIGYALVDISCEGECATPLGLGILVGAVSCAAGVSVVVVLTLRAMIVRPTAKQRNRTQ